MSPVLDGRKARKAGVFSVCPARVRRTFILDRQIDLPGSSNRHPNFMGLAGRRAERDPASTRQRSKQPRLPDFALRGLRSAVASSDEPRHLRAPLSGCTTILRGR